MRLLDKYLIREHLTTLLYCLLGFNMLQVVYDLFDRYADLHNAKLPTLVVLRFYASLLAPNLEYVMPASLLLATMYTLWQMTRHGELTAMRASGLSMSRIALPLLMIGLAASLATAAVKEAVAPRAALWADDFAGNKFRTSKHRVIVDQAYYNSLRHRQWIIGEFDVEHPEILKNVTVTQEKPDGTTETKTYCRYAKWMDGEWWGYHVRIQEYSDDGNPRGQPRVLAGSDWGVALPVFTEKPSDFSAEAVNWEYLSSLEMLRYLRAHPNLSETARAHKLVDFHSRLAMPWACLIVTLFGIPAGARNARESVLTGVLLTVGCFFAFYGMMQVSVFLGKMQVVPAWAAGWLTNIVFLAAGVKMLLRMR